jgi:RNA polymerase sigma factor for flagellar operon FliA
MSTLSSKLSHLPKSEVVLAALSASLPNGVARQDVEGVAWAAYHRWCDRVRNDPDADAPGYLYTVVRNAMMGEARRLDRLSSYTRKRFNQIRLVTEELKKELGRSPNLEEVAAATGIQKGDVQDTVLAGESAHEESLALSFDDVQDLMVSNANDPAQGAAEHDTQAVLRRMVADLPKKQRRVLELVVLGGKPVAHVAEITKTSPFKVRSLCDQAIARLRAHPVLRELAPDGIAVDG